MEYAVIAVVIVALGVFCAAQVTAKSRVWVVRIKGGVPSLVKGRIAQTVVADLAEVLERHSVRRGAIYGVKRGRTVTLGFSRTIPANCRQALRNVWSMHAR